MLKTLASLFVLVGIITNSHAANKQTKHQAIDTRDEFARAHQMVDIGGRRLNLYCSGEGKTTVIFDAPSGNAGWSWFKVQPAIAKQTRACVYDRAGLGFSDTSPREGSSGNAVDDLHTLLQAANIAPPYLMVGSSYGGANVQLYAYRYPDEVKGMVLVEGQHEDEITRINKVTEGKYAQMLAMNMEMEKACMAESERGFKTANDVTKICLGIDHKSLGKTLSAAQLMKQKSANFWRARISEDSHFEVGNDELRAARKPFGDLPMIVLVRSISPFAVPGQAPSALNKAVEAENLAMQKTMASLSSRGSYRIVPGASHIIHATRPDAAINAITDILAQLH